MTPTQPPQGVMAELRELLARRSAAAERIARSPVYIDDILAFDEAHDAARDAALKALPGLLDEVEALRADAVSLRNQRDLFRQEHERQHARASALLARCEGLEAELAGVRATLSCIHRMVQRDVHDEDAESIERMCAAHLHDSDCATHNEPAYPNGPCDCRLAATRTTGD